MFNFIKNLFSSNNTAPAAAVNQSAGFDGATFDAINDGERLGGQLERVKTLMADGEWRDLDQIIAVCGGTAASIPARLRDLRKEKFGGHTVNSQRVGDARFGYWQYQVLLND